MKARVWTMWSLAIGLYAADAGAFHPATSYGLSANDGGGSEMYFTGSERFRGYDCSMCHIDAPQKIGLELTSDPPGLFSGVYKPWQRYAVTASLTGVGDYENVFVAELIDDAQDAVGVFDEAELGTLQRAVGEVTISGVIVGAGNRDSWSFFVDAPGPDSGRLSFHIAAVSGDGAQNRAEPRPPTDPLGDDVVVARYRMCEEFQSCDLSFADAMPSELASPAARGCSTAPGKDDISLLVVLAMGLGLLRRRAALMARP